MTQKIKIKILSAIIIFLTFSSNITIAQNHQINNKLVHHVFFWLNEPENKNDRSAFEEAIKELLTIDLIKMSHFGIPAPTETRDVVDHSYTYSMILYFQSKDDQETYQSHPIHLKFVEENKHLWNKVIVYDSVDL